MYKKHDCEKCIKRYVCKLINDYNNTCTSLEDTNTDNYISYLECKHYEVEK